MIEMYCIAAVVNDESYPPIHIFPVFDEVEDPVNPAQSCKANPFGTPAVAKTSIINGALSNKIQQKRSVLRTRQSQKGKGKKRKGKKKKCYFEQ